MNTAEPETITAAETRDEIRRYRRRTVTWFPFVLALVATYEFVRGHLGGILDVVGVGLFIVFYELVTSRHQLRRIADVADDELVPPETFAVAPTTAPKRLLVIVAATVAVFIVLTLLFPAFSLFNLRL